MRPPMRMVIPLGFLLPVFSCSHPPPTQFEPRLSAEEKLRMREESILRQTLESLSTMDLVLLDQFRNYYDNHGIVIHWVSDSTFTCQSRSAEECQKSDPFDFYICPITTERLNGDPLIGATYEPNNDVLWLTSAEVSPQIHMLMVVSELSIAWQYHQSALEGRAAESSVFLQQTFFILFELLDELTSCTWSRMILESAQAQERFLNEERLSNDITLEWGSPTDGRLVNQAFLDEFSVESLDRNFLLSLMRIQATMARFKLQELRKKEEIEHPPIELHLPRD